MDQDAAHLVHDLAGFRLVPAVAQLARRSSDDGGQHAHPDPAGASPLVDLQEPGVAPYPEDENKINVNVAAVQPDGSVKLRTWERGSGLTRACGTGASATGVAAIRSKRATSPVTVTMPGGSLTIAWSPGEPVRMRGPATHVFTGEIDLAALA